MKRHGGIDKDGWWWWWANRCCNCDGLSEKGWIVSISAVCIPFQFFFFRFAGKTFFMFFHFFFRLYCFLKTVPVLETTKKNYKLNRIEISFYFMDWNNMYTRTYVLLYIENKKNAPNGGMRSINILFVMLILLGERWNGKEGKYHKSNVESNRNAASDCSSICVCYN